MWGIRPGCGCEADGPAERRRLHHRAGEGAEEGGAVVEETLAAAGQQGDRAALAVGDRQVKAARAQWIVHESNGNGTAAAGLEPRPGPAELTLQFNEPPWQGTLFVPTPGAPVGKTLFPFVTSLKTQPAASVALDVQLAPAFFANAYST